MLRSTLPHVRQVRTGGSTVEATAKVYVSLTYFSALLERRHGQAGVAELLPVERGGLLGPRPDDCLAGGVDAVGDGEALVHGHPGDEAGQRVGDVGEGVVVVVEHDHAPAAADARAGVADARDLDDVRVAHAASRSARLRQ